MTNNIHIRPETEADWGEVYEIHTAAFGKTDEADLVDRLREQVPPYISLVATNGQDPQAPIVGHIMFTPVTIPEHPQAKIAGLAPVGVTPKLHKQGIGKALILAGLEQCQAAGYGAVILIGHPSYYPRFGFKPGSQLGLSSTYDVPDEVFMALELEPGYLTPFSGKAHYHPAFEGV